MKKREDALPAGRQASPSSHTAKAAPSIVDGRLLHASRVCSPLLLHFLEFPITLDAAVYYGRSTGKENPKKTHHLSPSR